MKRHTLEPWRWSEEVNGEFGEYSHTITSSEPGRKTPRVANVIEASDAEANAKRIVACVNACKGLNPEAVPEMLDALIQLRDIVQFEYENDPEPDDLESWTRALTEADFAISKATGGGE